MLQRDKKIESVIERSLDRVKIFMDKELEVAIPAFSYTVTLPKI